MKTIILKKRARIRASFQLRHRKCLLYRMIGTLNACFPGWRSPVRIRLLLFTYTEKLIPGILPIQALPACEWHPYRGFGAVHPNRQGGFTAVRGRLL